MATRTRRTGTGTESGDLALMSRAEQALASLSLTPEQAKEIYDAAEAYRVYARNAVDQNRAATIKLRAAAKGGALLEEQLPRPRAGRPAKGNSDRLSQFFPELPNDARRQLSARWQRVASLAALGTLDAYLASVEEADGEITMAGLFHYATVGTLNSTAVPEWYTPARYVEATREVLGAIDLDPASSPEANKVVQAARYFTADDDSLNQAWHGRIFLNPPYGKSAPKGNALFIPKLIEEFEAGRTAAAIVLTSAHGTETDWFQLLWEHTLCFTDHRIPYWNEEGEGTPTFGSAFTYLGPSPDRFAERFAAFGAIVHRWEFV